MKKDESYSMISSSGMSQLEEATTIDLRKSQGWLPVLLPFSPGALL